MSVHSARPRARSESAFAVVALTILTLAFWKLRIIDSAVIEKVFTGSIDLYSSFYPRTQYAFSALRAGDLPLWNPYQLCGKPLLATPATGVFYPLNVVYLIFDVATATEIAFILHMLLGALGMFWLMRHFGIGILGACCSAVTFVWSGWLIANANQPVLFAGMSWMPLTVLFVDRVLRGAQRSWLPLALVVACQILNGATEVLVHALYIGVPFTIFRLGALAGEGQPSHALKRAFILVASVAAGVLLSTPQLLPSIELVRLSARAPGELSWSEIRHGALPPWMFFRNAFEVPTTFPMADSNVGFLPLLGIALVAGFCRHRLVWICGVVLAIGAALLVFGGFFFRVYYESPLGSLFRRPAKFLDIYAFGQALIAGVAIARLQSWTGLRRRQLWAQPPWVASLGLGAGALGWLAWCGWSNPYVIATLALLILFGSVTAKRLRLSIIVGLCVLQGATLFFGVGNKFVRPSQRPDAFWRAGPVMAFLREHVGYQRVYLPPTMRLNPTLTAKQGMLNRINVVTDYDPLSVRRYATFFDRVTGTTSEQFNGLYRLGPETHWRLLNLTGTRYLVLDRREARHLFGGPHQREGLRLAYRSGGMSVYENLRSRARAYFVPRARVVDEPEEVLTLLDSPRFDPQRVVLLEGTPAESIPPPAPLRKGAEPARIMRYEPEHVRISVDAPSPGFLVLTDLFYPGWKGFVDDREIPVYHANYLFRAVQVPRGHHEVRFEYRPASLHRGLVLSSTTALIIVALLIRTIRRRRRQERSPRV